MYLVGVCPAINMTLLGGGRVRYSISPISGYNNLYHEGTRAYTICYTTYVQYPVLYPNDPRCQPSEEWVPDQPICAGNKI